MTDKEWRVVTKALYIVHRFAADGSSEHAPNLRQSMVVLRNHHDSRRKVRLVCRATSTLHSANAASRFFLFVAKKESGGDGYPYNLIRCSCSKIVVFVSEQPFNSVLK